MVYMQVGDKDILDQLLGGNDPIIFVLLGDYYAVSGVPELAEEEWKKAAKEGIKLDIRARLKDYGYEILNTLVTDMSPDYKGEIVEKNWEMRKRLLVR